MSSASKNRPVGSSNIHLSRQMPRWPESQQSPVATYLTDVAWRLFRKMIIANFVGPKPVHLALALLLCLTLTTDYFHFFFGSRPIKTLIDSQNFVHLSKSTPSVVEIALF